MQFFFFVVITGQFPLGWHMEILCTHSNDFSGNERRRQDKQRRKFFQLLWIFKRLLWYKGCFDSKVCFGLWLVSYRYPPPFFVKNITPTLLLLKTFAQIYSITNMAHYNHGYDLVSYIKISIFFCFF